MKSNTFRVFAGEVSSNAGYIDIELDAIDDNGILYFVNQNNNSEEWQFSQERLQRLMDEKLIIPKSDVSSNAAWDVLEKTRPGQGNMRDVYDKPFAAERTKEAQRALFQAAYETSQ